MRSIANWFIRMFNWIMGNYEDENSEAARLDSQAQRMRELLEKQRSATTSQLVLVNEARENLEEELANNERLKEQAISLKNEGSQELLFGVMEKKIWSDDRLKELQAIFESLQEASQQAVSIYQAQAKEVEKKIENLELLKEQARVNKIREEALKTKKEFELSSHGENFDRISDEIKTKSAQLNAMNQLDGLEADIKENRVDEAVNDLRIRDAIEQLESKETSNEQRNLDVLKEKFDGINDEPAERVRKLLSEPPIKGPGRPPGKVK